MLRHVLRRRRALTVVTAALAASALVPLLPASASGSVRVGRPVRLAGAGSGVTAVSDTGRYVQMDINGRTVRLDRRTRRTARYPRSGWATMSGSGAVGYVVSSGEAHRVTTGGSSRRIALGYGWAPTADFPTTTGQGGQVGLAAISGGRAQTAPFVWNASTGTAKRLTVSSSGRGGVPSLSHNGRWATYVSYARSEPTGCHPCGAVYRRNIASGAVRMVSVTRAGKRSRTGMMTAPVVSDDGRYVYFLSDATDLVAGRTTHRWRLYVRDLVAKRTRYLSSGCTPWRHVACRLSVSADGSRLTFTRRTRTGSGYGYQVFLHDRATGRNLLASGGSSTPNGEAHAHAISGNGRRIVFTTAATNVAPGGAGTFIRGLF